MGELPSRNAPRTRTGAHASCSTPTRPEARESISRGHAEGVTFDEGTALTGGGGVAQHDMWPAERVSRSPVSLMGPPTF